VPLVLMDAPTTRANRDWKGVTRHYYGCPSVSAISGA
jgi:hypothetical protein